MNNTVKISAQEREILIGFHQKNIDKIEVQIIELQKELNELKERISELSGPTPDMVINNALLFETYSTQWALWKKAEYALKSICQLSTTREIAEFIYDIENSYSLDKDNEYEVRMLIKNLGATLKQKVDKEEAFIRIDDLDTGEIFYGLEEWWMKGTRIVARKYNRT